MIKKDIPAIFFSDLTGEPFTNCTVCDTSLLEDNVTYIVEKAMSKYQTEANQHNTVFELAICSTCAESRKNMISKESMKTIEQYFQEHVNFQSRMVQIVTTGDQITPGDLMKECMIKKTPLEELKDYQIVGYFEGDQIVLSAAPYLLSGEVLEEISEILSDETKDEFNRFKDEFLGTPSDLAEIFDQTPCVLF